MASTLEEANDYVVLNMEGLEGEEGQGDGMNIIMINPDEGDNEGQGESTEDSNPPEETDEKEETSEKTEDSGEDQNEVALESEEASQDSEVGTAEETDKEQENETELPSNENVEKETELPSSENAGNENPSEHAEKENPEENAEHEDPLNGSDDNTQEGTTAQSDDEDEVQPLVLGGYYDPDSPSTAHNEDSNARRSTSDFPILDFSDMDHLDLTGGASNDMSESAFQPQIISVQSGSQVDFSESRNNKRPPTNKDNVAMDTEKETDETSQDSSVGAVLDKETEESVSTETASERVDYSERASPDNSEPVIILSDEEDGDDLQITENVEDNPEDVQEIADDAEDADEIGDSEIRDSVNGDSQDSTPKFTELRAAMLGNEDPLVRKLAKKEKISLTEAYELAEAVRAYRKENNIEINDSPVDEMDEDGNEFLSPEKQVSTTPLNIITETEKGLYVKVGGSKRGVKRGRPRTIDGKTVYDERSSPEPVMTIAAPLEKEPDEITGNELKLYKEMIQNPKPGARTRTIRELLYHKEKGALPPGNYFTFEDCLIKEDQTRVKQEKDEWEAKVKTVTSTMLLKKDVEKESTYSEDKDVEISEETTKKVKVKVEKESSNSVSLPSKKPQQPVKLPQHVIPQSAISKQLQNKPSISMSKTNNQEMPPEGGSTIILPDGTTIKMSPQQAFNITSTINVPGSGGNDGYAEEEEGECYDVGEEDDLWTTHMTCNDCGELLPLEEVMGHMLSHHWENNPTCYKCNTCEAWFFNKEDYHMHMSRVVEKSGDFIKMDKLYKCAMCNKYFKDSEFFLKHLHRKHTDVDTVGSMKLLAEIQERQQAAGTTESKPTPKPVPKPALKPAPKPSLPIPKPVITAAKRLLTAKAPAPSLASAGKQNKPTYRSSETSMVRDINVRLRLKNKFKRLAATKETSTTEEGKIITAPSSESSEDEIPGDDADEVTIKEEPDSDRWATALSTGPPPKTIAPQPSQSPSLSESPMPPTSTTSQKVLLARTVTTTPAISILRPNMTGGANLRPNMTVGGANLRPNMTIGGTNTGVQGVPGAPIIPAAALRPFLNQNNASSGNVVLMLPNSLSGQAPRFLGTTNANPFKPGVRVLRTPASTHTTMSTGIRPTATAASRTLLHSTTTRFGNSKTPISQEPQRNVPLILQKRNSGRKVNPLLNRHSSAEYRNTGSPSTQYGQTSTSANKVQSILNEEGFDIPQFIEYNKPPTPPIRRRGRRVNPNSARQQRKLRKRRRRGRPRASSEEYSGSDDDEFNNWLEQVSEKADKREGTKRRRVVEPRSSIESSEDEYTDGSRSRDGSETQFANKHGKSTKRFNCNLCSRKFLHSSSLLDHMKTEHCDELRDTIDDAGDVMLKCQICDHCFETEEQLNYHSLSHLDETEEPPTEGQQGGEFECQYCAEKFEIEDHLNYHLIKHQIAMEQGEASDNENMNVDVEED